MGVRLLRSIVLMLLPLPALAGTTLHSWDLDDPEAIDCPICGDTYQCVDGAWGNLWQDRLTFEDAVPTGALVTGADVVLQGVFGCDAPSSAELSLSGSLIEAKELPGTCDCGDCASYTFSAQEPLGWAGYTPDGANHLDFVTAGNFCVDTIELTLTWELEDPSPDDDDDASDDDDAMSDDDDSFVDDDDSFEDDDDAALDDDDASDDDDDVPEAAPSASASRGVCASAGLGLLLWPLPLLARRRR
jgi:hypothetical protein